MLQSPETMCNSLWISRKPRPKPDLSMPMVLDGINQHVASIRRTAVTQEHSKHICAAVNHFLDHREARNPRNLPALIANIYAYDPNEQIEGMRYRVICPMKARSISSKAHRCQQNCLPYSELCLFRIANLGI